MNDENGTLTNVILRTVFAGYSVTKNRKQSSELTNFMGFTVIMIDDIVF